jgi:hypothetical protein
MPASSADCSSAMRAIGAVSRRGARASPSMHRAAPGTDAAQPHHDHEHAAKAAKLASEDRMRAC